MARADISHVSTKVDKLVWFEQHNYVDQAIAREKTVKKYLRKEKIALIEAIDPTWRVLASDRKG